MFRIISVIIMLLVMIRAATTGATTRTDQHTRGFIVFVTSCFVFINITLMMMTMMQSRLHQIKCSVGVL